jgi:hypothetical protein
MGAAVRTDFVGNIDFYERWEFLVIGNPMFLRNTLEQPIFLLRRNRMAMSFST